MEHNQIAALCLIITVISFLGFWVENVWLAVTKGFMDNRNMCLPFLVGYGLAVAFIFLLFGIPEELRFFTIPVRIQRRKLRLLVYFGIVGFCISLGEQVLGTIMEKVCGIVWWDYTRLPLHITKYTSVPTTLAFGSMITFFMDCCFWPLYQRFLNMPEERLSHAAGFFLLIMLSDWIYSMVRMYKHRRLVQYWRIDTSNTRSHRLWRSRHPAA